MLRSFGFKRHLIILGVCVLLLGTMGALASFAQSPSSASAPPSNGNRHAIAVVPFEFDPGKTDTVEATWAPHQGDNASSAGKNEALLLTKLTSTSTNAASGATITNVKGITLTEIGWDVRDDGHCGAGAPRFNVVTNDGTTHFIGCNSPPPTTSVAAPGSPDANGFTWHRKRYNPATAFPTITPTETVKSISIIFDEGVDTGPDNKGWTFLDNIDINGTLISQGASG